MSRARDIADLGGTDLATQVELDESERDSDNTTQTNIALLAFKTAVNGSLAKYNLQDQVIDEYTDATGIDAGASTNATLTSGVYIGGDNPTVTHNADATGTHGNYTWYKYTTVQAVTYTTNTTQNHDYLVVAGGGSGGSGSNFGAGGGAGGFLTAANLSLIASTTYTVTVGAGGAQVGDADSNDGGNSSITGSDITDVVSDGGGGGGRYPSTNGHNGGSGGGGGGFDGATGGTATSGQGNDGGTGGGASYEYGTGGGGGAGAAGTPASTSSPYGGNGGLGEPEVMGLNITDSTSFLTAASAGHDTGGARYFAGGGGGGEWYGSSGEAGGTGGLGGGGDAHDSSGNLTADSPGVNGTGGGGGGGERGDGNGAAGGSGIVIIRRLTSTIDDLTLQSTDTEAEAQPTKADMVMLVEDAGTGVGTVNTHIKGYVSRDSGTTFTEGVLVDEGDWGTDKRILAFHDLDISSQPTDKTMCYKITTHSADAEFNTKIHATSIGWR